jgi:hypothetical protein
VGDDEGLLSRWFEQEIEPLLREHRAIAGASTRRKVNHLQESVIATLEALRDRGRSDTADGGPGADVRAEGLCGRLAGGRRRTSQTGRSD